MTQAFDSISNEGESGVWHAVTAIPCPELQPFVLRYQGFDGPVDMTFEDRMPADLFYPIIINFGHPWRIEGQQGRGGYDSFVAGLTDTSTLVASTGASACVQMDLTPFGAQALFRQPLHVFRHHIIELADAFGDSYPALMDQLIATDDWTRRLHIVDHFVRRRLQGYCIDPLAAAAWQNLAASHGQRRIAEIAERLNCSREHLSRRFREHIGLTPKAVARVMRFKRARALAAELDYDWAWLSAECGYADQAHFIHEFNQLAGVTPSQFARSHSSNTG